MNEADAGIKPIKRCIRDSIPANQKQSVASA